MPLIFSEMRDRTGIATLNHPEKRNALSHGLVCELQAAFESFREAKARCVVLRAQPGAATWCAGHDIRELPRPGRDPLGFQDPMECLLRAVRTFPAPVIAMIEGAVFGGGCDLALSCDILIGTETASFSMTPAKVGIPYNASGLLQFVNNLGVNHVKEMFFTGAPVSAKRALRIGILNHRKKAGEIEAFTLDMARRISENSSLAIRAIKEQVRLLADAHPLSPETFERIQGLRRMVYDSDDYGEGIASFLEKRCACFKGE